MKECVIIRSLGVLPPVTGCWWEPSLRINISTKSFHDNKCSTPTGQILWFAPHKNHRACMLKVPKVWQGWLWQYNKEKAIYFYEMGANPKSLGWMELEHRDNCGVFINIIKWVAFVSWALGVQGEGGWFSNDFSDSLHSYIALFCNTWKQIQISHSQKKKGGGASSIAAID